MLGTLNDKDKSHWHDFVKPLVHAYNCTKHESTGFTPYELMFGRQPILPIDLAFNVPLNHRQQQSHSQYVKALKSHLQESYQLATKNAAKVAERNKIRYDQHVTESILDVGDRVLVRNIRIRGKHKLADKWESIVYVVVSQKDNLPVYTVKPEHQNGPTRTLHRDLLLPCGFLPTVPENPPATQEKPRRPSTRRHPIPDPDGPEFEYNSEEEDNYPLYYPPSPPREISRFFETHKVVLPPKTHSNPAVEQPKSDNPQAPGLSGAPGETGLEGYAAHIGAPGRDRGPGSVEDHCEPGDATLPDNAPDGMNVMETANSLETENVHETVKEGQPTTQLDEMDNAPDSNEETSQPHIEMNRDQPLNNNNKEHDFETEQAVRRSSRERTKPKLLTYPQLGNPLVSIVQSLFQSLSEAVTNSIEVHEIRVV